ncbi:hypothetical protein ACE1OA_26150 [Streptomyces sp. JL2001]|uniref:hypothetical protein n=1 Tax=Streptomyces sp. JL2001 TaxID=3342488 RepID=UPI003D805F63
MGLSTRTSVRTGLRAALAAGLLAAVPACSAEGADPEPRTSTPADICTSLVSYWAKEALKGGKWAGLDWEQKGLSNEQLGIHDLVLAHARAAERTEGRDAALAGIDRETRRRCEASNGATGSSENWRPPEAATGSPSVTGAGSGTPSGPSPRPPSRQSPTPPP